MGVPVLLRLSPGANRGGWPAPAQATAVRTNSMTVSTRTPSVSRYVRPSIGSSCLTNNGAIWHTALEAVEDALDAVFVAIAQDRLGQRQPLWRGVGDQGLPTKARGQAAMGPSWRVMRVMWSRMVLDHPLLACSRSLGPGRRSGCAARAAVPMQGAADLPPAVPSGRCPSPPQASLRQFSAVCLDLALASGQRAFSPQWPDALPALRSAARHAWASVAPTPVRSRPFARPPRPPGYSSAQTHTPRPPAPLHRGDYLGKSAPTRCPCLA